MTKDVNISIIHICIVFQKNLVFTPLRCYGISFAVYWYLLVRLWVELFVLKNMIQDKTAVSKKHQLRIKTIKMTTK